MLFQFRVNRDISTHALTEGDPRDGDTCILVNISTHALTEGDRRCDYVRGQKIISTHALTEGDEFLSRVRRMSSYFNSRPHGGRPDRSQTEKVGNEFQLTPSRRATITLNADIPIDIISTHALTEGDDFCAHIKEFIDISTHALTEGDGKFRQIFLLNRGYAYSISLYFLPHFISLLPQILSFQQKSFKFQVRIFLLFSVHLAFALQNQCVHHVKSRFCTNMFYFVFVLFTQIVKPQTIGLFIYDFF